MYYNFYIVVRHHDTGTFQELEYKAENEVLTERDLFNIQSLHADRSRGLFEVKTQIISWQRLDLVRN